MSAQSKQKGQQLLALHYYLGTDEKGMGNNGNSYAGISGFLSYLREKDKTI